MRGLVATIPFALVLIGGCGPSYIGTPCTPSEEYDEAFLGYDPGEVKVDTTSDPNVVCRVYHFRGRTTCPYGQDKNATQLPAIDGATGGSFPEGIGPCLTPNGAAVTGDPIGDPFDLAQVPPQCTDRPPSNVFFSCICANADGKTDDGASYCSCPSGTKCEPLVPPNGDAIVGLTQAYCIPPGSVWDPSRSCLTACDPNATTCP